jgi:5-methyltetrahydropteroyltriglutamate--homocysteine methyltransferase
MLTRLDHGELTADEHERFGEQVRAGVGEIVARQRQAGVDLVNDGEASKIGYSTYVKERLTGFEGEPGVMEITEAADFPSFFEGMMAGALTFEMPTCSGPVSYRDLDAVETDIENLRAAASGTEDEDLFMTAASPGVIAVFLQDRYYGDHEKYLYALADAMKPEYDAIHAAGIVLQVDCPDLAMARQLGAGDGTLADFRRYAELHVDALNHALRDIPGEETRLHLCWGNYEGPHHHDVALGEIIDIVLRAKPDAISFEGANPRHEHEWKLFEDVKLPDSKILIPGVLDSTTNYIEHPELVAQRIERYATAVGRENVIAGTDCGFATLASYLAIDPQITWAKLAAMSEGAGIASRTLW